MSPVLAIAAVAVLFLVLLVPLALAASKVASASAVAAVYVVLFLLIAGLQSGLFSRETLPDLNIADSHPGATGAQCAEVLSLLERAGAIIDRSRPPRLVVARTLWDQLPEAGQALVVDCVERSWPQGAGAARVEARSM